MSIAAQGLAWNVEAGENKRLKKIISAVVPVFVLMALYISWVELPEQNREELEALPPQLAKVILKKKEQPKPVVEKVKKIEKKEAKKIEPKQKIVKKPKPKINKPVPQIAKKPKAKIKHKPKEILLAREKAKTTGLLAMSSQLTALSALANTVTLDVPKTITAKPIARKTTDRLAASVSTAKSTGIDETQFTQDTQKMSLGSRQITEVAEIEEVAAAVEAEEQVTAEQLVAQRTSEELRRTMDANKSAIQSIYNRALRKKPSLQGIFTPLLVIEENGNVSSCTTESSTLGEPKLESKFCKRLRLVNFGYKAGVAKMSFKYPFDLLPG